MRVSALLCALGATAAAAAEEGGAAGAEAPNPTSTAQQAHAALFIEASVRKEVDLALRTFLRCEACQAIAFQVLLEFSVAEQRSGSGRGKLSDDHIAMALDEYGACTPGNFEEHRLYELNGTRYLSGTGMMIEDVKDKAGATLSPGNVTLALALRCLDATQALPPSELYEHYLENKLEAVLCHDDGQPCKRKERSKPRKGRKAKKKQQATDEEAAYADFGQELQALREELRSLEAELSADPSPPVEASEVRLTAAEGELARLRGLLETWSRAKYRGSQKVTILSNEMRAQCEGLTAAARAQLDLLSTAEAPATAAATRGGGGSDDADKDL